MAYDEKLAERIRLIMGEDSSLTERKMFGGLAFLYKSHMFVGVSGNKLMARVGKENYEESLSHKHVRLMDFTGKPMPGYVYIEAPGIKSDKQLTFWLELCKNFVSNLPAKPKKK
jgi:TfoX/Sxy family transcriptional regulator of competence genes